MKRSNYISVSIVLLALFSMLSCGDNIPEYKLLKIEKPKISANGRISPTQNLEYFIEIDHPLQNDSLELLQNHFIDKGKSDFAGINKIIVRVYVKGSSTHGLPYASLNLIGEKKDIYINGGSKNIDFLSEQLPDYEVLGCWNVYGESSYIICKKDGSFFAALIDKDKQKVGKLEPLDTKMINGESAFYSIDDNSHEFMVIMNDGLYIYDETNEAGTNAVVWSNDPMWKQ